MSKDTCRVCGNGRHDGFDCCCAREVEPLRNALHGATLEAAVDKETIKQLRAEITRIRRHVVEHLPCRMDAPGHPQCACGAPSQLEAGLCVACAEAIR